MQRRAAAIYFAFFLVIGAGAFGYLQVAGAAQPSAELDAPTHSQGDTFTVDGREYTVAEVTTETGEEGETTVSGTLEWTNSTSGETNTVELAEGENATLNGQTHVAHFPSSDTVQVSQDFRGYQTYTDDLDYFEDRKNGVLSVSIVSFIAAIILLGAAYLPVKD